MNFSCGNCKAIRSFSGEPPKCDVCGWVKPSYGLKQGVRNLSRSSLKGLAIYAGLAIVGWFVYYQFFLPEKEKVADEYHIPQSQVFVDTKPHGCDFDDAPLGNKHCHYERKEEVSKDEHGLVTGVYVHWNKVEE